MDKAVELFNRNLGLYITKVEGTNNIKLTFDKIDAANPRAQFSCIFCLQADDTYAVVSCEPMLSDVKLLEKKLNDDNDVKAFACAVRQGFKKLC